MKKIEKLIDEINKMLDIASKNADNAAAGYDEGFYVGKGEAMNVIMYKYRLLLHKCIMSIIDDADIK